MTRIEPEITVPVDLCLADGRLNPAAIGWSRHPLQRCALPAGWPRRKRWEFWGITTDTHLLRFTYGCTDYLGTLTVSLLDYSVGRRVECQRLVPFARGMHFPDTVGGGDIHFKTGGAEFTLSESPAGTRLQARVDAPDMRLDADVFVERPAGHETLTVVIPWSANTFQCTSKHNTRPARGEAKLDGKSYSFDAKNHAYGVLDFGRGVWPYRTAWNWAAASGTQDGHLLGLNLGGKWTDGTGMTENGLCIDGRLHKLGDDLVWNYDRKDFRRPWRIHAPQSKRVDVVFTPWIDESVKVEALIVRTELYWSLGTFDGVVVSDDGERIQVRNLLGWAEEHLARW